MEIKSRVKKIVDKTKAKAGELKAKVAESKSGQWIGRNKGIVIPAVIAVAGFAAKSAITEHQLNKEDRIKHGYIYDPELGHEWELKRRLSNKEIVDIDTKVLGGEHMASVLYDKNLLKGYKN